jgi:hypothetical protein
MKRVFIGDTIISPADRMDTIGSFKIKRNPNFQRHTEMQSQSLPVVTLFLCPPEIPLIMASPIMVSAQISRPRIYNSNMQAVKHKNWNIVEKNTTIDEKAFNMHDSAKIAIRLVKRFI